MPHQARSFAIQAHGDQTYGNVPYWFHLREVVGVLREYGYGNVLFQQAGWLHDSIEDTDVTFDELARRFGWELALLVAHCTDEEGHPNRKTRKAATAKRWSQHRVLYEADPGSAPWVPAGTVVKLADRIANIRNSLQTKPDKLRMYQREHGTFRAALHIAGVGDALWAELDATLESGCLVQHARVAVVGSNWLDDTSIF